MTPEEINASIQRSTGGESGGPIGGAAAGSSPSITYHSPSEAAGGGPTGDKSSVEYYNSLDEAGRKWYVQNKMGEFYKNAKYLSSPEYYNTLDAASRQNYTANKLGEYYKGLVAGTIAYGTPEPGGNGKMTGGVVAPTGNSAANYGSADGLTPEQKTALFKGIAKGSTEEFNALTPDMTQEQRNSFINKYGHTDRTEFNKWYETNAATINGGPPSSGGTPRPATGGTPPPAAGGTDYAYLGSEAYYNSLDAAGRQQYVSTKAGQYYKALAAGQTPPAGTGPYAGAPGGGGAPGGTPTTTAPTAGSYTAPTGTPAMVSLANLANTKLAPTDSGNPMDFFNDEGYKFRLKEGLDAVSNAGAAAGRLNSGATDKARMDYASGLASSEYGAAYGRYGDKRNFDYSAANADRNYSTAANQDSRNFDNSNAQWGAQFNRAGSQWDKTFDYGVARDDRDFNEGVRRNDLGFNYNAARDDRNFNYTSLSDLARMGLTAGENAGRLNLTGAGLTGRNNLTGAGATGAAGVGGANIATMTISELIKYLAGQSAAAPTATTKP